MMLRNVGILANVAKKYISNTRNITLGTKSCGIYEPDYLETMKPEFPQYEILNLQIKGYDFPVLESYQKFLHNYAETLELDVSECWATPPQHLQVQRFKSNSAVIDAEYKLTVFERNLQICDVQTPLLPVLLRVAIAALPEGVTLNVLEHSEEHDEIRYVPDKDLLELKAQLDEMGGPINTTKKK